MGGYSFMESTAAKPAPQEGPTEARRTELSGSEVLGRLGASAGGVRIDGRESHGRRVREQRSFRYIAGSVKLLIDSLAFAHYLNDRPG